LTGPAHTLAVGWNTASSFFVAFYRARLVRRIFWRFLLMIFIIWVGATVMFFVPRQFGINPSKAGFFTPSPAVQRIRDLDKQLREEYARLSAEIESDGVISDLEAKRRDLLANLITENDKKNTRTAFERQFGFGDPIIVQYGRYISALARFDLGASRRYFPVTVFSVIQHSLYWTLTLMGVSTILAFTFGSFVGGLMGWPGAPKILRWAFIPVLAVSAVPYFLLGWILIWFLAFRWKLFPMQSGWDNFNALIEPGWTSEFILSALHHGVLPALSIILATAGFWTVTMRGLMVNLQGEDYMVFGNAKGLKPRRLFFRYGIRNAILPQVTGIAASVGSMLSGVLLVEIVFDYPGIGFLFWQSIRQRDITMMTGMSFVIIVLLAVAMFVIDLLLPVLDRRIRTDEY
jgi:peptide/nickel transport system permease protein